MSDLSVPGDINSVENVSSHERVLMILKIVAQFGRPVSAAELIAATGLAKSTLYRQLMMLKRWGFVFEADNFYAPGPVSLQLSLCFKAASLLRHHARSEMEKLCELTRETVAITVVVDNRAVCIDLVEAPQALRCSFEKGRSLPLRNGATAKCLLAHLPDNEQVPILQVEFPVDAQRNQMQDELKAIRARGYAASSGEVDEGIWGISFPLFASSGILLGVLSLMAPLQRAAAQQLLWLSLSAQTAQHINARLKAA